VAEEITGAVGRWALAHLRRRVEQAGFAGRLLSLSRRPFQGLLLRLALEEVFKLVRGALPLTLVVGFIMGGAWAFIWLRPLAYLGGSLDLVTSFLITVNSLLLAPILVSVIVLFSYGASTIWELAVMKANGQFETFTSPGVAPEYFLALPRIGATLIALPPLLAVFTLVSFVGAYLMVWQYTGHSVLDFIISLSDNSRAIHFISISLKSIALSLSLSFFTVYGGFEVEAESLGHGADIISQALAEAFIYSILISLLVSAVLR
jgi:ABC-type transporter Mla maintaining outer membrane lipid asymmetry permease subunit MlaE